MTTEIRVFDRVKEITYEWKLNDEFSVAKFSESRLPSMMFYDAFASFKIGIEAILANYPKEQAINEITKLLVGIHVSP